MIIGNIIMVKLWVLFGIIVFNINISFSYINFHVIIKLMAFVV